MLVSELRVRSLLLSLSLGEDLQVTLTTTRVSFCSKKPLAGRTGHAFNDMFAQVATGHAPVSSISRFDKPLVRVA